MQINRKTATVDLISFEKGGKELGATVGERVLWPASGGKK